MTSVSGVNPLSGGHSSDSPNSGYTKMNSLFGTDLRAAVKDEFVSSGVKKAGIGAALTGAGLLIAKSAQGPLKAIATAVAAIGGYFGITGGYQWFQGQKVSKGLQGVNYTPDVLNNLEVYPSVNESNEKYQQNAALAENLKAQGIDYYQYDDQQHRENAINTGALQVLGQAGKTLFDGDPKTTAPKSTLPQPNLTITDKPNCGC